MKIKFIILLIFLTILPAYAQKNPDRLPKPTSIQLAWQDMELTMFIHFGPATWQDQEYDDLSTPLSRINPAKLNTDQWADVAVSYGAKMIIFCAKHTGGFAWWQTETTPYGIKETPWKKGKGDVLADLAASCKKRGLKLGIYLSPEDRYLGAGMGGKIADPVKQKAYEQIYRKQLTELLTHYGDIHEVWVDGSLVFSIEDLIKRYATKAVILQSTAATIRWVGNEMGFAPYPAWNGIKEADARSGNSTASHSDPEGNVWLPIEVDVSIRRPTWFWKTWNEKNLLTVEELMKIYYSSVGRGCVFLINACPDTTGLIAPAEAKRFAEFGKEIKRRFEKPVQETQGTGKELTLHFPSPQQIDHLILMEDISQGERVRKFTLEGKQEKGWKTVFQGSAIGHKLIVQVYPRQSYKAFRLVVNESVGEPIIRKLAAFHTGTPPVEIPAVKDNWNLRHVGSWNIQENKAHLFDEKLDITSYCKSAEQYEVAYVIKGGNIPDAIFSYDWANTGRWEDNIHDKDRLIIKQADLFFSDVESNHYKHSNQGFSNRVVFNLTGIPDKVVVRTKIFVPEGLKGAKIEVYLLRK